MHTCHIYRLHWQRRVALMGAGAGMGYGAFELARYVFAFPHSSGTHWRLYGAMALGLVGLYAVLYAWVYKVILADDAITVVGLSFGFLANRYRQRRRSSRISLCREEIAGVVRLPSAENPSILAFIPTAEGGEAAYVLARWVNTDEYFQQWCDSLPDLNVEDERIGGSFGVAGRGAERFKRAARQMKGMN